MEIQAAGNAYNSLGPGSGPSQRLVTTAWAKLNLFTPQQQLLSGYWKVPLRLPPMNLHNDEIHYSLPRVNRNSLSKLTAHKYFVYLNPNG